MNSNDINKFLNNNIKDFPTIGFLHNINKKYGNSGLVATITGNYRPITHPNVYEQYVKHYTAITWNLNVPLNYSGFYSSIPAKAYNFGRGFQVKLFPHLNTELFKENSTIAIVIIQIPDYSEVLEQGTINLNITPKPLLDLDNIEEYIGRSAIKVKIDGKEEKMMALNRYKLIDDDREYWMSYFAFCGPMKCILENQTQEDPDDYFNLPFTKQYTKEEKKGITTCIVLQLLDSDQIECTMALVKANPLSGKDEIVQTSKTYTSGIKPWNINTLTMSIEWINTREGVPYVDVPENNEIWYTIRSPRSDDEWIHKTLKSFLETIKVYKFQN